MQDLAGPQPRRAALAASHLTEGEEAGLEHRASATSAGPTLPPARSAQPVRPQLPGRGARLLPQLRPRPGRHPLQPGRPGALRGRPLPRKASPGPPPRPPNTQAPAAHRDLRPQPSRRQPRPFHKPRPSSPRPRPSRGSPAASSPRARPFPRGPRPQGRPGQGGRRGRRARPPRPCRAPAVTVCWARTPTKTTAAAAAAPTSPVCWCSACSETRVSAPAPSPPAGAGPLTSFGPGSEVPSDWPACGPAPSTLHSDWLLPDGPALPGAEGF